MYPKSFPKDMTDWQAIQDEFNAKQDNSTPLMVPEDAIIKPQAPIQSVPNNPMQDNIADDEAAVMPTVLGQGVPTGEEYQANFDKAMAGVSDQDPPAPKIDPREALLEEFRRMRQSDEQALKEARDSDRMLALGGAVGDSLATILNARSQMNVKAPGVQVQQGAGLANTLKNFQTASQVESDAMKRRADLLEQYKQMSIAEATKAKRELEDRRISAYEDQVAKSGGVGRERFDFQKEQADYKKIENLQNSFNKDKQVQKAEERIQSAATLRDMIDGNPITQEAAKTFAARASGEVGALSDQDRASFGGSKAIVARINQAMEQATTGRLSDENKKFMKELADKFENAGRRDLKTRLDMYSTQASKRLGQSPKDIAEIIRPDLFLENVEQSNNEVILRRDPKTGRTVEYDAKTKKPIRFVD